MLIKSAQAQDLRLAIACVLRALAFSLSCFVGTRIATGSRGLMSAASSSGVSESFDSVHNWCSATSWPFEVY